MAVNGLGCTRRGMVRKGWKHEEVVGKLSRSDWVVWWKSARAGRGLAARPADSSKGSHGARTWRPGRPVKRCKPALASDFTSLRLLAKAGRLRNSLTVAAGTTCVVDGYRVTTNPARKRAWATFWFDSPRRPSALHRVGRSPARMCAGTFFETPARTPLCLRCSAASNGAPVSSPMSSLIPVLLRVVPHPTPISRSLPSVISSEAASVITPSSHL